MTGSTGATLPETTAPSGEARALAHRPPAGYDVHPLADVETEVLPDAIDVCSWRPEDRQTVTSSVQDGCTTEQLHEPPHVRESLMPRW